MATTAFASNRPSASGDPLPARRTGPKSFGPTRLSYTFACTVCGKTFKRGTYDAALNPHKNKQGWPCPGRIGYPK